MTNVITISLSHEQELKLGKLAKKNKTSKSGQVQILIDGAEI